MPIARCLLLTFASASALWAGGGPEAPAGYLPVSLAEVGAGELMWKSERGLIPLPVSDIDVRLSVSGVLLHGSVTQTFHNSTDRTIEVLYAFPLPGRAAVQRMEMRIGERTIRSVVREREEARRTYEQARSTGRKAALLEGQRANLFTTSAANINPGETVVIALDYLDHVDYVDGSFTLTFPLSYLPRFVADRDREAADAAEHSALLGYRDVADGQAPTARIVVRLQPGVDLEQVDSSSHAIRWQADADGFVVNTEEDRVVARRDFRLRWTARLEGEPQSAVVVENHAEGDFAMITLYPPIPGSEAGLGLQTETLFVVDVSGSMRGPSIDQARRALIAALDRLRPDDRFNILRFNDASEPYAAEFVNAEPAALASARDWVDRLAAGGGTRIHDALLRAVRMAGDSRSASAQRIIFLTDGAVADEAELFRTISERLGRVRLHTIGIGHAPNAYLMRKMARFGRGLCRFVAGVDEADHAIDGFFRQLDRPVMTDLTLDWKGIEAYDVFPEKLPDLYAGQPLVVFARLLDPTDGVVRLGGYTRSGWVETSAVVGADSTRGAGIAARWARATVESLLDRVHEGADAAEVRDEVVELALAFDLVTRYTSLVAVEDRPTALDAPEPVRVAAVLPAGGTDGPLRRSLAIGLLVLGALLLAAVRR